MPLEIDDTMFPLMGEKYSLKDYFKIDLSEKNIALQKIYSQEDLTEHIKNLRESHNSNLAYGGYQEKRNLYQSELFQSSGPIRNIHLAIDVWADSGHPLYAPLDGCIHSIAYNDKGLDYGYTLILKHHHEGKEFYSLYGHLSSSIMNLWPERRENVERGQLIGHIGPYNENGGWSPHVHCQLIMNLEGTQGDYPGVCSEEKKEFYFRNCPNPIKLILPKK